MGFLGFGKKPEVLDLTERYRKQQEKLNNIREDQMGEIGNVETKPVETGEKSATPFGFFAGIGSSNSQPESTVGSSFESDHERKRKLAKRLKDMTEKLEEISNQMYHLTQRVELLERKAGVGY